jgi:phosphoglycolate phosphatase-like HAD superfamily hydrolase
VTQVARAVLIFDLDDTLVRSFPSYVALHQRVATDLGWNVPTEDELVPYGSDWVDTLSRLFPARELEPFMTRYQAVAHEHPLEAVPGAVATLRDLRAREHALFIVTKRDTSRLAVRLAEAGVEEALFDGIFPREAQPVTKPDPRCFEPVWSALGVPHGAGLSPLPIYVGDREEDRLAATGAGIRFIAVKTGPEVSLGFPRDVDATHVLASVADLPSWLDRTEG